MNYFLFLFFIFGSFLQLSSENEVAATPAVNHEPEAHDPIAKSGLTSENLSDIHDLAKNISHSKGIYREGSEEKEIRRSISRKIAVVSESDVIKQILLRFDSAENKVELLEQIEFLVHQYDVAISFAAMGGMRIIGLYLLYPDDEIVSSAALVLGAAMQSNPTVQKIAMDEDIHIKLLYLLTISTPNVMSRVIFAISSFLRNSPDTQEEFYYQNGLHYLVEVLKHPTSFTNAKLRIITLFSDLVTEQEAAAQFQVDRSSMKAIELHRLYADEILELNLCEYAASFLSFEDYGTHRRIVSAMLPLNNICLTVFRRKKISPRLRKLLIIYSSQIEDPTYPDLDDELRGLLFNDLRILYEKITETTNTSSRLEKSEL